MSSERSLKPVAFALSQWNSQKEILYMCPKCKTDFRILGNKELYCHHCGQKLDWSVIIRGNEQLTKLFFGENGMSDIGKQHRLMAEINYLNHMMPQDNTPRELQDYYEFACVKDFNNSNQEHKEVLGSMGIVDKRDDLPFYCTDCNNSQCAYSGKKTVAFCKNFIPIGKN